MGIKVDEMSGIYGMIKGEDRCILDFGRETFR
jgi:hypothetical protein